MDKYQSNNAQQNTKKGANLICTMFFVELATTDEPQRINKGQTLYKQEKFDQLSFFYKTHSNAEWVRTYVLAV